jgi:nucleotide-binding universal stress UspA family protein
MKLIVVPLDGSPLGEQALPTALHVALRHQAALEVVHVIDDVDQPGDRRAYIDAVAEWLRLQAGLTVTTHLLSGQVKDVLIPHLRARNPDLIVMSTHGRSGVARAWLGSVAMHIVHHATSPVLLIRPTESGARDVKARVFQKVLVPLDMTSDSERALDNAVDVAGNKGVEYVLLHVLMPQAHYAPDVYGVLPRIDDAELQAAAEQYLARVAARAQARGLAYRTKVSTHAHAAGGVLDEAREENADLISMETHGRRGLERLLLGSVADKVVRGADVPVLVQRPAP